MKRYEVLLTEAAERDLENIHLGLLERFAPERADQLLESLLLAAESLSLLPDRGSCPQELAWLGVREFKQLMCPPYRLIYRQLDNRVFIVLIADGRQDLQSMLERRLLDA